MNLIPIIPTLNEAKNIGPLVRSLIASPHIHDVIIVDGGSTDDTVQIATTAGATIITAPKPGRALQMNLGATHVLESLSGGEGLGGGHFRFVHADVILPPSFDTDIKQAVNNGFTSGCFRSRFDGSSNNSSRLRATTTHRTKYNHRMLRMGGQTVRVDADTYTRLGGFDETLLLCEDVDFYRKLYTDTQNTFIVLPSEVLVSARKFEINGYTKMYVIYALIYLMYRLNISQHTMIHFATTYIKSERLADAQEYTKQ